MMISEKLSSISMQLLSGCSWGKTISEKGSCIVYIHVQCMTGCKNEDIANSTNV